MLEHPGNFTHFKLRRQDEFPVLQDLPDSFNDIEEKTGLSESEKQALKKRAIEAVAATLEGYGLWTASQNCWYLLRHHDKDMGAKTDVGDRRMYQEPGGYGDVWCSGADGQYYDHPTRYTQRLVAYGAANEDYSLATIGVINNHHEFMTQFMRRISLSAGGALVYDGSQ